MQMQMHSPIVPVHSVNGMNSSYLQSSMWSWHSLVRTPYQTWCMLQTDDPTNGPALRTMEKGTSRTKCDCSEIRRPVHLSDGLEEGVPKTDVKGQSSLTLFVVAQLL